MKIRMNRTELLRYVVERVLREDKNPETSHILWDFLCSDELIGFFCGDTENDEKFHIWIRKDGLEYGSHEIIKDSCVILGQPYLKMSIQKLSDIDNTYELTIE